MQDPTFSLRGAIVKQVEKEDLLEWAESPYQGQLCEDRGITLPKGSITFGAILP